MHRHSTDLVAVLFGLAFVIAGTCFLVRETTDTSCRSGLGYRPRLDVAGNRRVGRHARTRHRARSRRTRARPESPGVAPRIRRLSPRRRSGARRACRWRGPCARPRRAPRPLAPTTSCTGMPSRSASANFTPGLDVAVVVEHRRARAPRSSSYSGRPSRSRSRPASPRPGTDDQVHVVRRERRRPRDAVLVVVLLDDRGDDARHADAVAAHHHRVLLRRARRCSSRRAPPSTSCRAGTRDRPRCRGRSTAARRTAGTGRRCTIVDEVGPHVDVEVATEHRVARVVVELVRAGDPSVRRARSTGSATTIAAPAKCGPM